MSEPTNSLNGAVSSILQLALFVFAVWVAIKFLQWMGWL